MKKIADKLQLKINNEFEKAGFKRAVLGLSGGIDSAVVAFLARNALGKENITGVKLPYAKSSKASLDDANKVLKVTEINSMQIEITSAVKALKLLVPGETSALRLGNIMARVRMTILFDIAQALGGLVLGTSNKTELLLGYGTLHGDLASIINPLGNLYKYQVFDLARYLGVPESLISKSPSADLEEDQTDEGDFGFSYQEADVVLESKFEKKLSDEEVLRLGVSKENLEKILKRVSINEFKRHLPIVLDYK